METMPSGAPFFDDRRSSRRDRDAVGRCHRGRARGLTPGERASAASAGPLFDRADKPIERLVPTPNVQAGIEEFHCGSADPLVDLAAVHSGRVDARLRKFIPTLVVTFVDEDLVVDLAGDHV